MYCTFHEVPLWHKMCVTYHQGRRIDDSYA